MTCNYNAANRRIAESENGDFSKKYSYHASENMAKRIKYEDEKVIKYFYYDDDDGLKEVVEHNGKVCTYGYDVDA